MARLVLRGRSAEIAHALSTLRRVARTRQGAVVTVAGAAGIGKSAFARAVADEARSLGFRVGMGQAGPETRAIPGAALLIALRSGPEPLLDSTTFSELASLYDRPIWLIDRIAELLAASATATPLLVAIDDVDIADDLTRLALKMLPARLSAVPVTWMLTSRTLSTVVLDETIEAAEAATAVARIVLRPLTGPDIDELARDRLGTVPAGEVLGAAGGNPFWADQLVRGLTTADATPPGPDDLDPVGMRATVRRRLGALSAGAVDLVRHAAVWGRPLSTADAAALLGGPDPSWAVELMREAGAGGVLTRAGETVAFPHAWVRDAVYAEIDAADRRARHRRCADILLDRPGGEAETAAHLDLAEAAGDVGLARRVLRTAAERVAANPAGAAVLARCGWTLVADLSSASMRDLARTATEILAGVERHGDVVTIADAVLAAASGPCLTTIEPGLWWHLAAMRSLVAAGRYDAVTERATPLLADARVTGADRTRLDSLAIAAAAGAGPRKSLQDLTVRAEQLLEDSAADPATRQTVASTRAVAARRLSRFGDAWRAVAAPVTPAPAATAERVRALQDVDRLDEAAALLEAVGAGAIAAGDFGHLQASVMLAAARQELDLGRLTTAGALALALAGQAPETQVAAHRVGAGAVLAEVRLHQGGPLDFTASDLPSSPVVEWSTGLRILHATAALRGDDTTAAVRMIMPIVAAYRNGYCSSQWSPSWSPLLLDIALRAGNRPLAEHIVEDARLVARHNEQVASWTGTARQVGGMLDGDAGELHAAVTILRGGPRPLLLARALTDHADLLVMAGDQSAAVPLLEEAADLYARSGAEAGVRAASTSLTRLGVRRRRETPAAVRSLTGWWSLTDTEQLVAHLIGAGHTNRSAATELGISPNTVNTHLRAVFGKLGVRSRVQLANVVRDQAAPK
ncbi:helix-turn-helix transcriptional regulator [Actinoplanes palleronii]|uniref:HTH luxR-type domain-containing protein n=1 Tax=Actinoplanes palleronii TaxID=113570 RepID=A0ABQ4BGM3_9ACTN|nr:LuxR family transcriptional regulator [Actinoplanes palleronii]GIE69461.1 hypothetical protein Apa02nite_055690 [Actinoplanes palleronii]